MQTRWFRDHHAVVLNFENLVKATPSTLADFQKSSSRPNTTEPKVPLPSSFSLLFGLSISSLPSTTLFVEFGKNRRARS